MALAESLLPGTALAFLLIEHGWAQPLFDAIAETGGTLLGEGFLTAEAGLVAGAEVAAVEEAAEVIAAAQAAEARAVLAVMTADAVAEDAAVVTAADEAAADAVAEGAATVRAASITMAEARILRYLPTRLTFALIAGKLGISRSAAKERARVRQRPGSADHRA